MRLDKFLANAGMTRSQAKQAVKSGRVTVDGVPAKDASAHIDENARVLVDGLNTRLPGHRYIMLNKPAGVVTANTDGRFRTVFDVLPVDMRVKGLSAVGRLDRDTTGLLLFTTDGELAHRLISPGRDVEKVYIADVDAPLDDECVKIMAKGVRLKDFIAKPAKLDIISSQRAIITVTQGKYHQVKRMFAALGRNVTALKRLSVAGISLDESLDPGQARELTRDEISGLYKAVGLRGMPDE
ncbi:MAG: pseudouridine synthase [Clostridia bacterium]|nr:pseudouridine synthase [Clostridia bacterium]